MKKDNKVREFAVDGRPDRSQSWSGFVCSSFVYEGQSKGNECVINDSYYATIWGGLNEESL